MCAFICSNQYALAPLRVCIRAHARRYVSQGDESKKNVTHKNALSTNALRKGMNPFLLGVDPAL